MAEQALEPFRLASGALLEEPVVAWEEYGNPTGPVALICHGGFSSHQAAGPGGYWERLIGPGRAIDTERYRVLAPNSLGAMFGTTGPLSRNPATGQPYGANFPDFTLEDSVHFYRAFLRSLGIEQLALVAGLSMGSCQSLLLAALYPQLVEQVVAVATAGRLPVAALTIHNLIINLLRLQPGPVGIESIYLLSRMYYNHERGIQKRCWHEDPRERNRRVEAFLFEGLESRQKTWDAESIIAVLRALNTYDLGTGAASYEEGVRRIRCPVLAVNFLTDCEFAPLWAQELAEILGCRCELLDSDWGHLGCIAETAALAPLIADFLSRKPWP